MSYYAKQTLNFSKMPEPLVDKIVDFYASIMNQIDYLKRGDLNYDLDSYHKDYLYKYDNFKSDEAKSALRNLTADNVYFYLNELEPNTEKELKKYVPANLFSDPQENYYMLKIDDHNNASLDESFNLNYDASSFFNESYILDGNRIIWKKSGWVDVFETCYEAESYIIEYVLDCCDGAGEFVDIFSSKEEAIDMINNYIKDNELDKTADEDNKMLLKDLHKILDDLNKHDVKNDRKSSLHR